LLDRFRGCLLGQAVGDALGARFEAQSPDWIARRFPTPRALIEQPPTEAIYYTDDTQMMIGVGETLADHGEIIEDKLCQAFVVNYVPSRGYGWGARKVLEAMEEGRDYRQVAESHFPGGSFGNGAAMRVAPVGLVFHRDLERVTEQAHRSALPTHLHPLGIEGAQLLALAVALCTRSENFDRHSFFHEIVAQCRSDEFRRRLTQASECDSSDKLPALGNGIAALDSVATAIACFALTPKDYATTIAHAILLGGDTDTIAAMAGALSGAYLGSPALPTYWLDLLEDVKGSKGRTYIIELSERLCRLQAGNRV
jgi:poly(ADP-ribose) glycohydrolase ARH3